MGILSHGRGRRVCAPVNVATRSRLRHTHACIRPSAHLACAVPTPSLPSFTSLCCQLFLFRVVRVQSLARRRACMRRRIALAHAATVISRAIRRVIHTRRARAWRKVRRARERVASGVMQRAVRRLLQALRSKRAANRCARVMTFSLQVCCSSVLYRSRE
jgi:hypothetical protein